MNKCNCEFESKGGKINLNLSLDQINLECPRTWSLIGAGNTKGCFQLESRLGQSMAKKLKPINIEQLSALISIMRPGCLEAYRDGKSVSNHYIDKKNQLESVDYYHESLKDILDTTYGEMIYQEQAMQIAQKIAGFNLEDADMLRKAIGKKKPEEMAKLKKKFLAGSEKTSILTTEQSQEVFNWIEKSQRYSFNKSHAISYAMNAYLSAYIKCHFPRHFFASYLRFAKDKIDPFQEISDLVNNCREMGIEVCKPNFLLRNKNFILHKDGNIYFGLTDIKGVGESIFEKIQSIDLDFDNASYLEILFIFLDKINKTASKAMLSVGCFDYLKQSRKKMLFDYDIICNLTAKEKEHIISNIKQFKDLNDCLEFILLKTNSRRKQSINSLINSYKNPAYSLEDTLAWIAETENQLLGISISCSRMDECDLDYVNTDCRAISNNKTPHKNIIVGVEIKNVSVIKTKRGANPGQEMAFIKISDNTGAVDTVIFPEEYKQFKHLLAVDNTTIIKLETSKQKDSMIIKRVWQA